MSRMDEIKADTTAEFCATECEEASRNLGYLVARVERLEKALRQCAKRMEDYMDWARGGDQESAGTIRFSAMCAAAREARTALEESE